MSTRVTILQASDLYLEYYSFLVGSIVPDITIKQFKSIKAFLSGEEIAQTDLLIVDYKLPHIDKLLTEVSQDNQQLFCLVVFEQQDDLSEYDKKFKYSPHIAKYLVSDGPDVFEQQLQKLLKFKNRQKQVGFSEIKLEDLLSFYELPADIYLQLGTEKMVKIFNRFDLCVESDFQKYQQRGVSHFYLRSSDYNIVIKQIIKKRLKEAERVLEVKELDVFVPTQCHEAIVDMVNRLGLEPASVKLAAKTLNKTLALVAQSKLQDLVQQLLRKSNYISEHSLLVTFLASGICKGSDWFSHENLVRLNVAAFFHDLKCPDEKVAKITQFDDQVLKELTIAQQQMLEGHIVAAQKLVEQIAGMPSGVDKIILSHHERYDGSGFPRHLDYRSLDPLSAIFIVAHELVDYFYINGFYQDNVFTIIEDMQQRYTKGAFPKIINTLPALFVA